jgi:mannose-1-phosphate guanylyltransferase
VVVDAGAPPGLQLAYSPEEPILGSAGGPKRALPLLAATRILVVNGDTLTDASLATLTAAHAASGALVTLAVVPNREPHRYGGVIVGEDGEVSGFVHRGAPGPSWHFIGVQVLEAAALADVPGDRPAESVSALYPQLIRERPGSVRAFRCTASFHDIGTPADYLFTSLTLAGGDERLLVGERSVVHAGASVSRSILWEDVTVARGARLDDCIVTDGVSVPPGAFSKQILVSKERAAGLPAGAGAPAAGGLLVINA